MTDSATAAWPPEGMVSVKNELTIKQRTAPTSGPQLGGEPDVSPDQLSDRSDAARVAGDTLAQMIQRERGGRAIRHRTPPRRPATRA